MNKEKEKIRKALFDYSIKYGYGDDLRGVLTCAIEILGLTLNKALEEIKFILKYEK